MLLETIKSLVKRSKKRKDLGAQTQPFPGLARNPSPDSAHTSAQPVNTQDLNARTLYTEQTSGSNFFSNAQNCVFNNLTVIANTIDSSGTVLRLLAQKRIPGAEVDSSARDPPPKCHSDTRRSLRGRIVHWVDDPDRYWRMLWIIGPMGVGKSAVAQTTAEEFKTSGRLGASLFFSRPNHRDDPNGVIPTLAYQLAVKCPEYKRVITQRLADDVTILEKNRRTQFKELIIEPFQILIIQQPHVVREPFLIILDGLDECNGKEAQCEFIELISDHVRQVDQFPLVWMICSRPEWHLKALLSHPDFQVACQREDLFIDDTEAQQDVTRVLEAGFKDIHRRYYDRLDAHWPPEASIRYIAVTASGHFAFASTIIKFVGNQYRSDPQTQLDICIRFLGGSGTPGAVNPLHALDLLYRQILSDVPRDILATTMRILGLSILYPYDMLSACVHANFLCLNQATFYRSPQHLHSVIDVPAAVDAHRDRIHFYHASFADYLRDPLRSGSSSINEPAVCYDVAIHSLKWLGGATPAGETEQDISSTSYPHLKWVHSSLGVGKIIWYLWDFSSTVGWRACRSVSDEDVPQVVAELENFDFRVLKDHSWREGIGDFLAWLYKLGNRNNSLICLETPTDLTLQDTEIISVTHSTHNVKGYLSVFGCRPTTLGRETKLRLRLGRSCNTCRIQLVVASSVPSPSFLETPPPSPSPPVTPLRDLESLSLSQTPFNTNIYQRIHDRAN